MNLQYFMMKKKREKKQAFLTVSWMVIFNWFCPGEQAYYLLACKQLAFALQFLYSTHSLRDRSASALMSHLVPQTFYWSPVLWCPDRREVESMSLFNKLFVSWLCHQFESIFYSILGLTWHEVLTIGRIYAR